MRIDSHNIQFTQIVDFWLFTDSILINSCGRQGIVHPYSIPVKRKFSLSEGLLFAARLQQTATKVGGAVAHDKTVSVKVAHELLGHMDESATRKAAANHGWTLT